MRRTTRTVLAATALSGLAAAPATAVPEQPVRERGVVLECAGTDRGREVHASIYENGTYGNVVAVVVGDLAGNRQTTARLRTGRHIEAGVRVAGHRATVSGTAHRVGAATPVHDAFDDAGEHVVVDGVHRRLATDLDLTYRGRSTDLICTDAFAYDLRVTKTPLV